MLIHITAKEWRVLELLNKGFGPTAMAKELGIQKGTAKAHLAHLYRKFDIDDRYHKRVRLVYLISGGH